MRAGVFRGAGHVRVVTSSGCGSYLWSSLDELSAADGAMDGRRCVKAIVLP